MRWLPAIRAAMCPVWTAPPVCASLQILRPQPVPELSRPIWRTSISGTSAKEPHKICTDQTWLPVRCSCIDNKSGNIHRDSELNGQKEKVLYAGLLQAKIEQGSGIEHIAAEDVLSNIENAIERVL